MRIAAALATVTLAAGLIGAAALAPPRARAQAPAAVAVVAVPATLPTIQDDALAARRAALRQRMAMLGAGDVTGLKARVTGSPTDDAMVELGYAYSNAGQASDASSWWGQAASAGNSFGDVALAEHASSPAQKRHYYMLAAELNDADAEEQYALMLLSGSGGPKLPNLGAMVLIDAAEHGDLPAMVLAGAAFLHLGNSSTPFAADVFPASTDLGRLFLDRASADGLKSGNLDGLRLRRDAYTAGVLTDPTPNHSLTDANFMDYLREYRTESQSSVIAKAQQAVGDTKSAPWVRAQEERVWLSQGSDKTLLLTLSNNDPQNLTVLYFNVGAELAQLPEPYVFHDAASLQLATKVMQEGQTGLTQITSGAVPFGLDSQQAQKRQAAVRQELEKAAGLTAAVAEGDRWVNPGSDPERITLDYLDQRGGMDKLLAIQSAHLTILAHVSHKLNDDNQKDVRREIFVAEDGARLAPTATFPSFAGATDEVVIASTQLGWYLRANNSAETWQTDQPPNKRDKSIPPTFGMMQAPAAGDLDDPLLEWARARKANTSWGSLSFVGKQTMPGQNYPVYELQLEPQNPNLPTYRAFITTDHYVLVQLSFFYPKDPEATTTINYNYREVGSAPGSGVTYPTRCDVISSTGASENDTVLAVQINPAMSPGLFRMDKDGVKPLKDMLDANAKARKNQ